MTSVKVRIVNRVKLP